LNDFCPDPRSSEKWKNAVEAEREAHAVAGGEAHQAEEDLFSVGEVEEEEDRREGLEIVGVEVRVVRLAATEAEGVDLHRADVEATSVLILYMYTRWATIVYFRICEYLAA